MLVEFLTRIVIKFGCDDFPIFYGNYFHVIEVDGVDSIWGTERTSSVFL